MSRKKHPTPFLSIGASSLLVVFLVLAIMIFAVLSFVSAKNDYEYSRKMASSKAAYYKACNQAEEALYDLSRALSSSNGEHFPAQDSFLVPIDDHRQLLVSYDIVEGDMGSPTYKIKEWKVEMRDSWEGNSLLNLPSYSPEIP